MGEAQRGGNGQGAHGCARLVACAHPVARPTRWPIPRGRCAASHQPQAAPGLQATTDPWPRTPGAHNLLAHLGGPRQRGVCPRRSSSLGVAPCRGISGRQRARSHRSRTTASHSEPPRAPLSAAGAVTGRGPQGRRASRWHAPRQGPAACAPGARGHQAPPTPMTRRAPQQMHGRVRCSCGQQGAARVPHGTVVGGGT